MVATAVPGWPAELATGLAARLAALPATTRIVAIDGRSGSGKTSLAAWLAPALAAPCVHVDDIVPGWYGLARSVELLAEWVVQPLAAGSPAQWRKWDWDAGGWGRSGELAPAPIVVVEGCGAGAAAIRPWLSALVWLEVGEDERLERLRRREDWGAYEPWLEVWSDQERALRAGDDPRPHATVVVRPAGPAGLAWQAPAPGP
jgi:cytidylate kinase